MAPPKQRTMFAYSLHARTNLGPLDYPLLFSRLGTFSAAERQTSVGSELVAVSYMTKVEGGWLVRFIAGEEGVQALYYDPRTGDETLSSPEGQLVASAGWMFVNPQSRVAAIERRRPGVGVGVMARALGHLASELQIVEGRVSLDLNPVVADSFAAEVDRYERIRQASIVLARPNFNWGDNVGDLTEYADESNADDVEVAMSARRGESLSKGNGIVADILNVTKAVVGPVKNLRIVGRRVGESKETAVSLTRHQEKRTFTTPAADPRAEREAFEVSARGFIEQIMDGDSLQNE